MSDKCKYASNNKCFHCPPRMADGRHFTDYRPNCDLQSSLNTRGLNSNSMRDWLISNADAVMANNRKHAIAKNGCGPCRDLEVGTMLPEQSRVRCDKRRCYRNVTDVNGLGQGRMYSEEPLAGLDAYGEVVVRTGDDVNCCGRPEEVFNYYGDAVLPENAEYMERETVLGGKAMHGGDPEAYDV